MADIPLQQLADTVGENRLSTAIHKPSIFIRHVFWIAAQVDALEMRTALNQWKERVAAALFRNLVIAEH